MYIPKWGGKCLHSLFSAFCTLLAFGHGLVSQRGIHRLLKGPFQTLLCPTALNLVEIRHEGQQFQRQEIFHTLLPDAHPLM